MLTANYIFTLLGSLVRIQTAQLLGVDKEHLTGQERLQLRICFVNQVLCPEHCRIYLSYNTLKELNVAVFCGYYAFPVPLVHIKGMQIAKTLIGTDSIHIGIYSVSWLYIVFCQREAFPFGQRMNNFGFCIAQILDRKCNGTLHSVKVIVYTHSFEHKQWSGHATQLQTGGKILLKELLD